MSVESYRESPGEFDSRTLSRETLSRWTGRMALTINRPFDPPDMNRVSTEVTFGQGDLSVCPLGGFTGAHE